MTMIEQADDGAEEHAMCMLLQVLKHPEQCGGIIVYTPRCCWRLFPA